MPRLGSIYETDRPYVLKLNSGEFLERMVTIHKPKFTANYDKAVSFDKIKAINMAIRLRAKGFEVWAFPQPS